MNRLEKEILSDAYHHFLETDDYFNTLYAPENGQLGKKLDSLYRLQANRYVVCGITNSEFASFELTLNGIEFIENGFQNPSIYHSISGNNNVVINGNNNTVSADYSTVIKEINSSSLSDEEKLLLTGFLESLKDEPENRISNIKAFLSQIGINVISSAGCVALTQLLYIFSNLVLK